MRTLRLLFWLRWRIALNTTSKRGRWAVVAITTLFALALSPIYVGGAIGAHALAAREPRLGVDDGGRGEAERHE